MTRSQDNGEPLSAGALSARKRLLSALASYDSTARRIANLPLSSGYSPGGAQDRLQRAIGLRAAVFLQERMAMLRGLGAFELEGLEDEKAKSRHVKNGEGAVQTRTLAQLTAGDERALASPTSSEEPGTDDRSARLAVLLEQETLVRGYLEEAQARRQLEDASSLNASLDELFVLPSARPQHRVLMIATDEPKLRHSGSDDGTGNELHGRSAQYLAWRLSNVVGEPPVCLSD